MSTIEPAALWLALIVGAWAALIARLSFSGDPRLVRSGGRALHAGAALFIVAVLAFIAGHRGDGLAATDSAAWLAALRGMLSAPDGMLLLVAASAALATAFVPGTANEAQPQERRGAQFRAGMTVTLAAAITIIARASWGDATERATPIELFDWSGMAFRVLYAAGIGALAGPIALTSVPGLAQRRLRACAASFGIQILALTLAAWSRFGAVSPAPELDPTGALLDAGWTTGYLLLLVPPTFTAAAIASLYARVHHANLRARAAVALLLLAAALMASAVLPAIRDWVVGREVEFGMPLSPLHAWEASLALAVAVVSAAWLTLRAFRVPTAAIRLMRLATAGAIGTLGLAVLALSTEARQLTLAPGATAAYRSMGQEWRFASQGASQEEAATYDGALVAFEVLSGGATSIVTAGERIYRDAHGHPAGRVAVPGVIRGLGGDLRITVRALRGDEVLLRAQFHPLASVAWLMAAFTAVAFAAFAMLPQRGAA